MKRPPERVGPEPKPPRTKHGTRRALEHATRAFCTTWYRWRHGEELSQQQASYLDFREEMAASRVAYKFEEEARKILDRLLRTLEWAEDFATRYPKGAAGLRSENVAQAAPRVRRALVAAERRTFAHFGEEASRRTWLRGRMGPYGGLSLPDAEAAIYSILGGFWPESLGEGRIASAAESGGISVAEVLRVERKNIATAKRKPKTLVEAERWFAEEVWPALQGKTSA